MHQSLFAYFQPFLCRWGRSSFSLALQALDFVGGGIEGARVHRLHAGSDCSQQFRQIVVFTHDRALALRNGTTSPDFTGRSRKFDQACMMATRFWNASPRW